MLSVYCVHVYHRERALLLTWPETLCDLHSHCHQYHICTKKRVIIKKTKEQQKLSITRILLTELWIASPGSSITCLSERYEKTVRKTRKIFPGCSPRCLYLNTTHRHVLLFDTCTIFFCYFFLTSCPFLKRFSWILPPKDKSQLKQQSALKSSSL